MGKKRRQRGGLFKGKNRQRGKKQGGGVLKGRKRQRGKKQGGRFSIAKLLLGPGIYGTHNSVVLE